MQFSNTTTHDGLVQDVDTLCGTTNATYDIKEKTRNINQHYREVVALIHQVIYAWQYDDSNKSDLPIYTTTLVNGQKDYEIPSTAQRIDRVEILNSQGDYERITQKDYRDITSQAMSEYLDVDGEPIHYDLIGTSIFLYPSPATGSVTMAEGLKLYVSRDVDAFTTGDTSKAPGIAKAFHRLLSLGAALDYGPIDKDYVIRERDRLEDSLKTFYGNRNVEEKAKIVPANKKKWRQYTS